MGAVLVRMLLSASNRNAIQRGLNIEENMFLPEYVKSAWLQGRLI